MKWKKASDIKDKWSKGKRKEELGEDKRDKWDKGKQAMMKKGKTQKND